MQNQIKNQNQKIYILKLIIMNNYQKSTFNFNQMLFKLIQQLYILFVYPLYFYLYLNYFMLLLIIITILQISKPDIILNTRSIIPLTAGSLTTNYTFNFINQNSPLTITNNSIFVISFPSSFAITAVSSCNASLNLVTKSPITCKSDSTNNYVNFTNLITSDLNLTNLTVSFTTSGALYSGNIIVQFYFVDSNNNIISSSFTSTAFTITPATMTCSIQSSNNIVGANSTFYLKITPSVTVMTGNIVQIVLPTWGPFNISNFINGTICSSSCSSSILSNYEYITLPQMFSTNTSSNFTINISSIKNPPSTLPISLTIIIKNSAYYSIQNCSTTLNVTTPNLFSAYSFPITNNTILAQNNITLSIKTTNPLPVGTSYLRIISELPITYTYYAVTPNSRPNQVLTQDGSLLIGNLSASSINSSKSYSLGNFILTNPNSIQNVTVTILSQNLSGSTYYSIDSQVITINATQSNITNFNVLINNTNANQLTIYTVSFININPLINNSFILINFPSQTIVNSISSSCSSGLGSCSISNTNQVNLTVNTSISSNTNITIVINNVQNPYFTTVSSSFTIFTYYNGPNALVDQLISGMTIQATPNTIRNVGVTASSYQVKANSNYTFNINFTNNLVSGIVFVFNFPQQIQITADNNNIYLLGNPLNCNASILGQVITLSNCNTQNTDTILNITLNSFINPLSTKPTSNFNITSYYNNNLLQYLSGNLTIAMTTPTNFNLIYIKSVNNTISALTTYNFNIKFAINHYSGDKITIGIPNEVNVTSIDCYNLTGFSSATCSLSSGNINMVMYFDSSTSNLSIGFSISGFTNNWYPSVSSFTFKSYTNDTAVYIVESGSQTITFDSGFLGVTIPSDNGIILNGNSSLKISIFPTFSIPSNITNTLYMKIILPSSNFIAINNCSTNYGICTYNSSSNGYQITSILSFSNVLIVTVYAKTSYFTANSSSLNIQLHYTDSNNVSYVAASNTISTVSVYCTAPCSQCLNSQTQCLTCLPSSVNAQYLYLPSNYSCVSICPTSYYLSSSSCLKCSTSCYTCLNTSINCTSCPNLTYLSPTSFSCLSTCPTFYYANNATWICSPCVIPCSTCSSVTFCLICSSNYTFYNNTCVTNCPIVTMIPYNGYCTTCTSPCLTCSNSLTICTSCNSTLLLYLNNCINACPINTYSINSTCILCTNKCYTCTSETVCTSCNSNSSYNLLYNHSCLQICPSGTIPIASQCIECSSNCITCSILVTNCTTCSGSLLFYKNTCLNECPGNLYPYNGSCITCLYPCESCTGFANNCTSCNQTYLTTQGAIYLYNNTCIAQCPNGYYIDNSTYSCLSCGICLTCFSLTNCTACNQANYLLDGLCYIDCPKSNPIISGQTCAACDPICLTCSLIVNNCTSCFTSTYLFRYTCVRTCPIGLYTNKVFNACQDNLYQKIIFFPFLITCIMLGLILGFSKIYSKNTAVITSLVATYSLPQLALFIFYTYQVSQDQQGINIILPLALAITSILLLFVLSILFYLYNLKKVKFDQYYQSWISTQNHYTSYMILSHIALLNFKFYRIIYCRLFNIHALSMIFKSQTMIFPQTTIFTIVNSFLSSIMIGVSSILMIYLKSIKDQVYYTSIQCLIVTFILLILGLLDIHKNQDFFNEAEYLMVKKFVEGLKDGRKKQEQISVFDAPSLAVQSQKGFGSAQKTFYKKNSGFMFEESSGNIKMDESESELPVALSGKKLSFSSPFEKKDTFRINIFDSIKEVEAEYCQQEKIDSDQQAIKQGRRRLKSHQSINNEDEYQRDEVLSVMQPKKLRKKWNNIVNQRHVKAKRIYNKSQIEEQEQQQQQEKEPEPEFKPEVSNQKPEQIIYPEKDQEEIKIRKRKRMKITKGMEKTQIVYLQRLVPTTEKEKQKKSSSRKKRKNKQKDSGDFLNPDF